MTEGLLGYNKFDSQFRWGIDLAQKLVLNMDRGTWDISLDLICQKKWATVSLYFQVEVIKLQLKVHHTAVIVHHRADDGASAGPVQYYSIYETPKALNHMEHRWDER